MKKVTNLIYIPIRTIGILVFFLFSLASEAQCDVNTINPSFEEPTVSDYDIVNESTVPGWETTASDNYIEIWSSGFLGVPAYSGNQFVELNAYEASGLYQDYDTSTATYFNYSFAHRGRDKVDDMVLKAGPPGGPYTIIKNASTGTTAWVLYSGNYKVPAGQTQTRFIFEAVDGGSQGNFLDAIVFTATIEPPAIAAGPVEICSGATATFNTSPNPGDIITWYDATGTLVHTGPTFTTPSLTADTTYQVKREDTTGCLSSPTDLFVKVVPLSDATISGPTTACQGDLKTISITGTPNAVVTYAINGFVEGTVTTDSLGAASFEVAPLTGNTTYSIVSIKEASMGCENPPSTPQEITINVPLKPTDIVTTDSICSGETYTWTVNNTTYTTSQSGLKVVNDGCTADQVLNLTVTPKPTDVVTTDSICSGETYTWTANGLAYTTPQSGLKVVNDGCTADQVLNLTVTPKPTDVVTTDSICSGETYTWTVNNTTYTTSQSGLRVTNDGCTADQVLNLTVTPKPVDVVTTDSICSGETYTWAVNNTTYTTSQSGLRIANDGCTADQVLNLTVTPKPVDVVTTDSICSGETYTWAVNNTTYTTSQSGLRVANDGCTADQVLNLTVTPKPVDVVTTDSICSGETYTWTVNNTTYTTSQSGLRVANDGCTADQVLNLTVTPKPVDVVTTDSICSGETYTWAVNNTTYTTSQSGLRIANDGCTADQVLNLTVTPKPVDVVTTDSICSGETYTWAVNNTTYTTSQSGLRVANDGCTADQVLNLTVTPKPVDVVTTDSICSGETYTWTVNNTTYTTSQSGLRVANDGCTADQVLNLTVTPKPVDVVTTDSICSGETYTWTVNNTTYTTSQSGLRVANDGCTADQVLNLTVTPKPVDVVTTDSICSGETYTWTVNNTTYTTSQSGLRVANDGCTADQVLNLTVTPKPVDVVTTDSICSGETYTWTVNNTTYTTSQSGLRVANDGCTADQVLNLTVTPKPVDVVTTDSICSGETYTWAVNNTTYTTSQSGLRIANDGCTADQVLNLTVTPKPVDVVTTDSICSGETYTWTVNNTTYTTSQSGLRVTNDGCTADQVLNLTVTPKPVDVVTTDSICSGETYTWTVNNTTYTTSQSGLRVANDGCTADQVLNLTVTPKPVDVVTTDSICSGETYTWAVNNTTYTTSQSGLRVANDGCTADQVLNLTVTPKPVDVVTTDSICSGETYTWTVNNTTYTTSQSGLRVANDGCTADQVLNLTVTPKPVDVVTTDSICSGETYTWTVNNTTYTTSQSGLRVANDGCTADQVLNLTVTPKPVDAVTTDSICSGETYTWTVNNTTYTTSQSGLRVANDGCTADQVLNLTVTPKPTDVVTTDSICSGETYTWTVNNTTYTTSQSGLRVANDGCTADQVLNLTVTPKPTDVVTTDSICSGETYTWTVNNTTYTTSQSGLRVTNDGCTADQVLNLTVTPKPVDVVTTDSICSGETYTWAVNNTTYTTSQSGLRIVNDGCTADQVLNLTVTPKPEDVVTTANICSGEDYYWAVNDTTYTTPQSGLRIVNDGCTADQVLNLTVTPKPEDVVTTANICSGEDYYWAVNDTTYTTPQSGLRIVNDGCTADQVLNLTVTPKPEDEITRRAICSGESYVWLANGESYSAEQDGLRITNDGCRADEVLYLTIIPKPEDIITRDSICYGDTYRWDANGKYYTTEQDGLRITKNGCTADRVLYLTINPPLIASIVPDSLIPELCSGDNNGSFSVAVTGGIAPYSASLDEINGTYQPITGTEQSYANLSSGEHIVYIKDTKGCTTELSVTIVEGAVLDPQFEIIYDCVDSASANRVMVTVDASNTNLADIDYALDTGNYQASNIFINVAPGLHTIYARNSNGCVQPTRPLFIKEIAPLTLTLADGELNEIVATATGGSEIYQYSLNDGPKGPSNKFIIYKSGVYTVSVTDTNGCTATESRYFEYIDICTPNYFTPNADGINDTWGPDCATNYKNLTYTIFDRYGRILATYGSGQRWDGRYKGTELTSGDYWYTLKLNDPKDNREFVGHFTLYR